MSKISQRSNAFRTSVLLAGAVFLSIEPLAAQNVRFDPSIALEQGYSDNVGFSGAMEESDTETRLQIVLPWDRETRKSRLRFSYTPTLTKFGDFDQLDNDGHKLSMEYDRDFGSGSGLALRLSADRTQTQGDAAGIDDSDLFLTDRTERDRLRADLRYRGNLKGRWGWGGTLGLATTSFEEITDFAPMPLASGAEDRDEIRAGISVTRAISRKSNLGIAYDYGRFDLDMSGNEDSHQVSIVGGYEVSRNERLSYTIGGFQSNGEAAVGGVSTDDSRHGFSASISYEKKMKRAGLNLALRHEPTSGGARVGTSTNTSIALGIAGSIASQWRWSTSTRYAQRDSSDEALATLDTIAVGGEVERDVSGIFSVRLQTNYITQSGGDSATDETSTIVARLGLVWRPLGRSPIAR
ncbi:MAG: hypothetical protein OEV00_02325 [Acidobacteriota bacterium]|nr:hypothetical protein [Acidobacteriota bacterium]MDH3784145.1 hypothetical protein [Acidobacteriota bacterium]